MPALRYRRSAITLLLVAAVTPIAAASEITRKPLRNTQAGTAEKPAVFDGKDMVIDLGIDVTDHPWQKQGDIWTSTTAIAGPKPIQPGMHTAIVVHEVPITLARKAPAGKSNRDSLKPGEFASPMPA